MSRHWSKTFSGVECHHGCELYGACPKHTIRLVWIDSLLVIEVDPDPADRPGDAKWQYMIPDDTFAAAAALYLETEK